MPSTITNKRRHRAGRWTRIPITVECNRSADEDEAVAKPEVEQLPSFDQPPSLHRNVALRKRQHERVELHQPRPMRKLAIQDALAHFEEMVNHTNVQQMPVATQSDIDAVLKLFNWGPVFTGQPSFKPPRSPPFNSARVQPHALKSASPIPPTQIHSRSIPSPDLPIHLHHHHGELPPPLFKLCRALIASSEEAAKWWGGFEAEPEPEKDSDEDEESQNGGEVNYARRGSFRYSPDVPEDESGWARGERTADIDDLDVSVNPVRQWHSVAYLADDELSDSDSASCSRWSASPPGSPDPIFPHARPVSPDLLASGMATVRLVPRSTTSAEPDLPPQGADSAILSRMGSTKSPEIDATDPEFYA